METASAKALQTINRRLQQEETPNLKYLHALHEISEVYPNNIALTSLLNSVHSGMSNILLSKEEQLQALQN